MLLNSLEKSILIVLKPYFSVACHNNYICLSLCFINMLLLESTELKEIQYLFHVKWSTLCVIIAGVANSDNIYVYCKSAMDNIH